MPLQRDKEINHFEASLLIGSQAQAPEKLFDVLLGTAIKESWIIVIINLHVAIFFGLILLASGYNETASLAYLGIQLLVSVVAGILLVFLISQPIERLLRNHNWSLLGLMISDALIAAGWGSSILIYFVTSTIDQANMLVALLLAAGISTAAMSAKLLRVLLTGRILVFLPTIVYLLFYQPPNWLLHSTSLFVGFAVCMAVGYAIHVQLLREASLVVELAQTQQKIIREADFREHFLKAITHDLRQPLSATKLFLRRLKKNNSGVAEAPETKSIDQCLHTAGQVIDDVAQLSWVDSKLPKITATSVQLEPVIDRVLNVNREIAKQHNIKITASKTRHECPGDSALLERAIANIVKNAIEHSEASELNISTTNTDSNNELQIRVHDNGKGIEAARQKSVFQAFQTGSEQNQSINGHMGIGLSIVSNIMTAHSGRIDMRSSHEQGTTFILTLPKETKPQASTKTSIESALVIDDDHDFAEELVTQLSALNISVVALTNPEQIESLENTELPSADAYFIDYRLNDTLRGDSLLQVTQREARKFLISDSDDPRLLTIAASVDAVFVHKPSLAERIEELLHS